MLNLLRNLNLDRISFWLGFLFATFFWWLLNRQRSALKRYWLKLLNRLNKIRRRFILDIETQYRELIRRHSQGMHLSSKIFSLDEILITPRLLSPPPFVEPGDEPPYQGITSLCIPYTPDFPELGTVYKAHTNTILEALGGGANLALIGHPGSGKTVALAYLASKVAAHDPVTSDLQNHVPVLINAGDLLLPRDEPTSLLDRLVSPILDNFPSLSASKFPNFMQSALENERVLLLLDGVDELSPSQVDKTVSFLKEFFTKYPKTRAVIAASLEYYDGLPPIGFFPVPMVYWGRKEQAEFLNKWREVWDEYLEIDLQQNQDVDPVLLDSWLLNQDQAITPLEFSLRVWAAYTGDVIGPQFSDSIESYINRITADNSQIRIILEKIALHSILSGKSRFTANDAKNWIENNKLQERTEHNTLHGNSLNNPQTDESITVKFDTHELTDEEHLLVNLGDQISFTHPIIAGYLASQVLNRDEDVDLLLNHPPWCYQSIVLQFLASQISFPDKLSHYKNSIEDPLYRSLLTKGAWLREIPKNKSLRSEILNQLSNVIQNDNLPLGVRSRVLTILCVINDSEVNLLFRHWLDSESPKLRQLAALGCGYAKDPQAINKLADLFQDLPPVSSSACLALANIGTPKALDALATGLLQGSDELRIRVAEALANHPEEGHSYLMEGRSVEDLLVRRSIVFGLRQVGEPWAIEMLETIQLEDEEWLVRAAAEQMQEILSKPDPHIPHPLPPLEDTPWLIAFAGEMGTGVSPGEPARKMLIMALRDGNDQQRLAALYYIRQLGEMDIFPTIFHLVEAKNRDLSDSASHTLWHLNAMGISIPPPNKFGIE